MWNTLYSRNHHMYSDVMTWLLRRVVGIKRIGESVKVSPCFFDGIDWARGATDGTRVGWVRSGNNITLSVESDLAFVYNNTRYERGKYTFEVIL